MQETKELAVHDNVVLESVELVAILKCDLLVMKASMAILSSPPSDGFAGQEWSSSTRFQDASESSETLISSQTKIVSL